jgi:hypothetical protein
VHIDVAKRMRSLAKCHRALGHRAEAEVMDDAVLRKFTQGRSGASHSEGHSGGHWLAFKAPLFACSLADTYSRMQVRWTKAWDRAVRGGERREEKGVRSEESRERREGGRKEERGQDSGEERDADDTPQHMYP